jgi:anaerobic sulfite reductase subunit C
MKWTPEAETAIKKVPFFVRKRVKSRVEKEATEAGKKIVSLAEVKATQTRYLSNMASEVKGYQIDICFGPNGCPNRAMPGDLLLEQLTALLKDAELLSFLKERVKGKLKFHHEFRITLAECPNACSQPQIKDVGIIGACMPVVSEEPCTGCKNCVDVCKEKAISLGETNDSPYINEIECLACGQCVTECPTGTLVAGECGHRIQLGGKLGRHPRLAKELPGIYSEVDTLEIISYCLDFYKENSLHGERFADLFDTQALKNLLDHLSR